MTEILDKLFTAADNHGEDSGDPDHTVGDLQDLLRRCWAIMSDDQRQELLDSEEVADILEAGGRDEILLEDLQPDN